MTVNFAQKTLQAPLPEGEFRRARALFSFRTVLGIFQCSPKNCWMSEYLTLCLPSRRLVRNTRKGKYQRLYHTNNTSLNQINNMNLKKGKKPKRTPNTVLDIVLLGHFSCDRLEKAMAPHSSTLAWKIPWTKEPGGLQSMGSLKVDTTEWLPFHFSLSCFGEGNGNPLQCSCLENPRDVGAWWAAVYGVAQSRTWLKWLSSSST